MRPTYKFIEEAFSKYNDLIFDGALPKPVFRLTTTRLAMGVTRTNILNNQKYISIDISIRYDLPKEDYINTIVHEMIHYYIDYNDLQDNDSHGKLFVSIMNQINANHNLNIKVVGERSDEMVLQEPKRIRYICVATFNDATFGVMVAAKNKLFDLWNVFNSINQISAVNWYASDSQFLSTMPVCVSPRLLRIDENTLFSILETSIELESDGQTIRSKMKA